MVTHMIPKWEAAGLEVRKIYEPNRFVPADALLLHVDLSVVPKEYVDFAHRYPRVINGKVTDLRKRLYSENLISPGDNYEGPVIVKTSFNHGGVPEAGLRSKSGGMNFLRRAYRWLDRKRKNSPYRIRTRFDYRLYSSMKDVPDEILNCEELIVEKFLPEREGDNYRLRYYFFIGNVEVSANKLSDQPFCLTGSQTIDNNPIPEKIREVRQRMGLDYGKIDYGFHEGKPVLYDVNRSAGVLAEGPSAFQQEVGDRLSEGIYSFFPEFRPMTSPH